MMSSQRRKMRRRVRWLEKGNAAAAAAAPLVAALERMEWQKQLDWQKKQQQQQQQKCYLPMRGAHLPLLLLERQLLAAPLPPLQGRADVASLPHCCCPPQQVPPPCCPD